MKNGFFDLIVRRRALVVFAAAAVAVAGVISWNRLPIDAFPDVTNQQVMILTEAEGLSSGDVERQVTFPVEITMSGLPHVKLVRSLSKAGLSQVVVVFEDHVDTYFARQLVFERLQSARDELPEGLEPEMGPISTGLGEVFQYTLRSDEHSLAELRTMQDWIISPRLRSISGVNEVNSFGGFVKQFHVLVSPSKLLKFGLTLEDVVQAVARNNENAGGNFIVKDWEQQYIRSVGLFTKMQDIADIVLTEKDGTPVYLSDVASIEEGHATRLGAVTRNGEGEAIAGMVIMLKGENAQSVVEKVRAALPSISASLPDRVSLDVFYDRTDLVGAVIRTVSNALLQGAALVLIVLFLLIGRLRAAVVCALSLPMTALFAFVLMDAAQVSANLMSLGGIAVAIGMVVDGAIVVTENTLRKQLEEGNDKTRIQVIAEAVREVARPVLFSILIIIIVFLTMFALEGVEGRMFKPLALTLVFAMMGSLVVALVFTPAVLGFVSGAGKGDKETRFIAWMRRKYQNALSWTLRHSVLVIVAAVAILLGAAGATPLVGMEFLPDLDEGAIAINVVRLPDASLEGSVETAQFMERELLEFPEVKTVVSKTGRAEISEDPMGPEQTDVLVMLHPESEWTTGRTKPELVAAIQKKLSRIPGIRLAFSQPIALRVNELISGVKSDLAVKVFGEDLEELKNIADQVASTLRGLEGAEDVSVEQVTGSTQIEVVPDRPAMARYGLNVSDINDLIETAVGGEVATTFIDGQKRFDVLVRYPESVRNNTKAISNLLVPTDSGALVTLGRVARLQVVEGPAQISRENSMRRVVVEANVRGKDLGGFVAEAKGELAALTAKLPPGYWLDYGGTFENQERAMKRFSIVIPIAILLIFVLLVTALGRFKSAALVLINLPFALVGGLVSMILLGADLSVPSTVGFIALFGMAVQNGAVLITFIEQLRSGGEDLERAVVEGSGQRLRALIMTAATTILGLVPMIYAAGPGSEIQRPLAVVVIGGLLTSTLLTLFVLPTIYFAVEKRGAGRLSA